MNYSYNDRARVLPTSRCRRRPAVTTTPDHSRRCPRGSWRRCPLRRPHRLQNARWVGRDPIEEPGFNLLIRSQNPFNLNEEKNLYGFCYNNPLTNIDPDGREIVTVAITAWSLGKGISHLICGAYYCSEAMKCRNRAQELLDKATPGLQSTDAETALKWAEWLRAAKPGAECAELWAACGKEAALTAQWVVGGYIVKYGIRYAKGYGKPD